MLVPLLRDHDLVQDQWAHVVKEGSKVACDGVDLSARSDIGLNRVVAVADVLRNAEACLLGILDVSRCRHFAFLENPATSSGVPAEDL